MILEDKQIICDRYGINSFEFDSMVAEAIGDLYRFYCTGMAIGDKYITGYILEDGVYVRKTIRLTKVNIKKIVKLVEKKLESFISFEHQKYIVSILKQSNWLLDGIIKEIKDNKLVISFVDKRLGFFKGIMPLNSKYTLKKDIIKGKYKVGNVMSFAVANNNSDFLNITEYGFTIKLTRRSNIIITKHLNKIEKYLRERGFNTSLSIVSISYKNNFVIAKSMKPISTKQKRFISDKLGMDLIIIK